MSIVSRHIAPVLVLAMIGSAYAGVYRSGETVRINAGDSLATDLVAGSRDIEVAGYVDDDVYAGCQRLVIAGDVTDDVLAACQQLTVGGKVGDKLVGFAQNILIDGEIGGDVLAYAADVRVTKRGHIRGNLHLGTGSFRLDGGRIDGWVRGGAGSLSLNGSVGDSLRLEAGSVEFGPDYRAQGTTLIAGRPIDRETLTNAPEDLQLVIKKELPFYRTRFFYWSFISMFIVGVLGIAVFRKFSRNLINYARGNLALNLGVGLLFLLATPVVILILAVLILTIPMALILLAFYVVLLYLGSIITGMWLGYALLSLKGSDRARTNLFVALLVGLILVGLLTKIPLVGWLIHLAIICFGSGSFVAYFWNLRKTEVQAA